MIAYAGLTPFFNDAVAATKVEAKTARAKLHVIRLVNTTAAVAYLQIFDKLAAVVTVGTTVAKTVIRLNANEILTLSAPDGIDIGGDGLTLAGTTTATGNTGAAISVFLGLT